VRRHGGRGLITRTVTRPLHPVLAPLAGSRLRRKAVSAGSIDQLLDLAYGFEAFGITIEPGQVRAEIRQLLEIVHEQKCRRMLEIGTSAGGTLFLFARVAGPPGPVISVDLPRGAFGGGYPIWKAPLFKAFAREGQRLELIRANSHDSRTVERVRAILEGEALDFLFIDGDHSYDGVKLDFELYAPLVRPGGLIALHDISPPGDVVAPPSDDEPTLLVGDVPRFWGELKSRYRTRELVEGGPRGFFGIGLLFV
jgi:predicted O-methyltransferase YrrM